MPRFDQKFGAEQPSLGGFQQKAYISPMFFKFGSKSRASRPLKPPMPGRPFYAIGDIHGHAEHLLDALSLIERQAEPTAPVVCIGDYIDRGPASKKVLDHLQAEERARGVDQFICLMGNHEAMLIDCLKSPQKMAWQWIRAGGSETVGELGVSIPKRDATDAEWIGFAGTVRSALGSTTVSWLHDLRRQWSSGNVLAVHAGADPRAALDAQSEATLLWGHRDFLKYPRTDENWILHGHTIVEQAKFADSRIAIDTGVYATGRLTVARIGDGDVSFFTV